MRPLRRLATTQMPRTTATKAAGIDLLDRLYCNQILVHLVFGLEERDWLRRLATRVRVAVAEKGVTGLQAERLKHWTLCLLEIFLADELYDLAKRVPFDLPPLPAGLSSKMDADVNAYKRDFFAGIAVAVSESRLAPEYENVALEIASGLKEKFRSAPSAVRHRLVERVLAIEFPDAPIYVFAWLAEMGVVPSAKFRKERSTVPLPDVVAVRAASICEFEMLRSYVAGSMRLGRHNRGWAEALLTQMGKPLSNQAKDRLLSVMQAAERRQILPALKNSFAVLIESRWRDEDYMASFFANCHSMAPYIRTAFQKQSTALTDIAAAMMMIKVRKMTADSHKALYTVEAEDGKEPASIAHDVSTELCKSGFQLNARTIYRHYSENLQIHVANLSGYFKMLKRFDTALPAEYEDIYHYYQAGFTL